jgi:hypothetical protein
LRFTSIASISAAMNPSNSSKFQSASPPPTSPLSLQV